MKDSLPKTHVGSAVILGRKEREAGQAVVLTLVLRN